MHRIALAGAVAASILLGGQADASLIKNGVFVTDTATGLQFVSPFATRDVSLAGVQAGFGGYLASGFGVAASGQVLGMITANFGALPPSSNPTAAGYTAAGAFFDVFGVSLALGCPSYGSTPANCPRTQGITVDGLDAHIITVIRFLVSEPNTVGLPAGNFGGLGNELLPLANAQDLSDNQLGVWLVSAVSAVGVPEPASALVLAVGLAALARRRRMAAA